MRFWTPGLQLIEEKATWKGSKFGWSNFHMPNPWTDWKADQSMTSKAECETMFICQMKLAGSYWDKSPESVKPKTWNEKVDPRMIWKVTTFEVDDESQMDEFIQGKVGGHPISMIINSGSKFNLLSQNDWEILQGNGAVVLNVRTYSINQFKAYAPNQLLQIIAVFEAPISVGNALTHDIIESVSGPSHIRWNLIVRWYAASEQGSAFLAATSLFPFWKIWWVVFHLLYFWRSTIKEILFVFEARTSFLDIWKTFPLLFSDWWCEWTIPCHPKRIASREKRKARDLKSSNRGKCVNNRSKERKVDAVSRVPPRRLL